MTDDDWDDESNPRNENPRDESDDHGSIRRDDETSASSFARPQVPPQLQNWRVVEIEGTATSVNPAGSKPDASGPTGNADAGRLVDRIDELLLVTVPERNISVQPDHSATYTLSLLNNDTHPALIEVTVAGEVGPGWFPELPMRVSLQAGERESFVLMVAPPLGAEALSGDYEFELIARLVEHPARNSRVVCRLTIERHTDFGVGLLEPEEISASWWSPAARATLPVANLSNHANSFRIMGADSERSCLFEFETPGSMYGQVGQAMFTLGPGARSTVGVSILPKRRPVVSLWPNESHVRIAVEMAGLAGPPNRQVADGRVVTKALIGPWQMVGLAAFVGVVLTVILMSSAVMLFALRSEDEQAAVVPAVIVPTQAPVPAFAVVLNMDEPVPTRQPDAADVSAAEIALADRAVEGQAEAGPDGLPVVQAGQVSAPGERIVLSPWTSPTPASRPTPVTVAPVDPANLTYGQMFRQVASRYDLNWRMLAAQGYVESGFDSTAVGGQGSLGLMQIHPDTWQEWAPRVDATDPFDTYGNAMVAAVYLDYLRTVLGKEGYPQVEWMLAAYNWGPDKVLDHVSAGGEWADLPSAVQQYVTDVLRIAQSIPEN